MIAQPSASKPRNVWSVSAIIGLVFAAHFSVGIWVVGLGHGHVFLLPGLVALAICLGLVGSGKAKLGFLLAVVATYLVFSFVLDRITTDPVRDVLLSLERGYGWRGLSIELGGSVSLLTTVLLITSLGLITAARHLPAAPQWVSILALGLGIFLCVTVAGPTTPVEDLNSRSHLRWLGLPFITWAVLTLRWRPLQTMAVSVGTMVGLFGLIWLFDSNAFPDLRLGTWSLVPILVVDFSLYGWWLNAFVPLGIAVLGLAILRDQLTGGRISPRVGVIVMVLSLGLLANEVTLVRPLIYMIIELVFDEAAFCQLNASLNAFGIPLAHACGPLARDDILVFDARPLLHHQTAELVAMGVAGLAIGACAKRRWPWAVGLLGLVLTAISLSEARAWDLDAFGEPALWDEVQLLYGLTYVSSVPISAPLGAALARRRLQLGNST